MSRKQYILAFLGAVTTGLLLTLSFPTTELYPLVFMAYLPLLYFLHPSMATTGRLRFFLGLSAGLLYQGILFRWIPFTMANMAGLSPLPAFSLGLLFTLLHALQPALYALFLPFFTRGSTGFSWAILAALFYACLEWFFPMLFPWGLGEALSPLPMLSAPLLAFQGLPFLSFWCFFPSAALVALLHEGHRRPLFFRSLVFFAGLFLLALSFHALLLGEEKDGPRVVVLQPNYSLEEKKGANTAMRRKLFSRLKAQLQALDTEGVDFIVASEGAFPFYWQFDAKKKPTSEPTKEIAKLVKEKLKTQLIMGGLRKDENGQTRNSVLHFLENGEIAEVYDKQVLVPFSEAMPLSEHFAFLRNIRGVSHLKAGESACQFSLSGLPMACGICYESMFSRATRRDLGDSRLLLNFTIDTWFGESTAPHMHLMTHRSRGEELGVPLVRASLTGISAIFDGRGRLLASLPLNQAGEMTLDLPLQEGSTLYREIGQCFAPLSAFFLLVLGWRQRRKAQEDALAKTNRVGKTG